MLAKVVVSSVCIAGINTIAQRNPSLAGWVASFPLITLLSIGWLLFDQRGETEIGKLLTGVLWGLVPTAFFLIVTTALVTRGAPLPVAVAVGLAAWIACFFAARQLGLVAA